MSIFGDLWLTLAEIYSENSRERKTETKHHGTQCSLAHAHQTTVTRRSGAGYSFGIAYGSYICMQYICTHYIQLYNYSLGFAALLQLKRSSLPPIPKSIPFVLISLSIPRGNANCAERREYGCMSLFYICKYLSVYVYVCVYLYRLQCFFAIFFHFFLFIHSCTRATNRIQCRQ